MRRFWGKVLTVIFTPDFGQGTTVQVDQFYFWLKFSTLYKCCSRSPFRAPLWLGVDTDKTPGLYLSELIARKVGRLPPFYGDEDERQDWLDREVRRKKSEAADRVSRYTQTLLRQPMAPVRAERRYQDSYLPPTPPATPYSSDDSTTGLTDFMGAAIGALSQPRSDPQEGSQP